MGTTHQRPPSNNQTIINHYSDINYESLVSTPINHYKPTTKTSSQPTNPTNPNPNHPRRHFVMAPVSPDGEHVDARAVGVAVGKLGEGERRSSEDGWLTLRITNGD